ncbi:hypothetical protein J2Z42_000894 [Clostridium algifaecis]|uniref:DUF1659 domain-containing protein n=1 Tax=Clostridium algifaecis TaxID=1472040 RepID=A0ABS4KTR4_9CLOT|nr:DUF1659 domain-containing protein [Clostridium algifaecis]MBP2032229.1 hypothetical protein [Clostridium algifaecis]
MAAKSNKLQTSVTIKYKDGVNESGKDVIKLQKFSKVKVTASDDSIYNTAKEIEKLLGKSLVELIKTDENDITNA